jgi:hypothetical protein
MDRTTSASGSRRTSTRTGRDGRPERPRDRRQGMQARCRQEASPETSVRTAEDVESVSASPFDPLLETLRLTLRKMSVITADSLSDAELRTTVSEGLRVMSALEAIWLRMVRSLDKRPGAVAGARRGKVAMTFLTERCRRSPAKARADVRAAHAIDGKSGELPVLGSVFSTGDVSREHLDVAVRALHRIPKNLRRGGEENGDSKGVNLDSFMTGRSLSYSPTTTDRLVCQTLAAIDPAGQERRDEQARERRELTTVMDSTGMLILRGQLDSVGGAVLRTAIEHYSRAPSSVQEGTNGKVSPTIDPGHLDGDQKVLDGRDAAQRNADALVAIARIAMSETRKPRGSVPAHLLIMTTPNQVSEAQKMNVRGRGDPPSDGDPAMERSSSSAPERSGGASCLQMGPISSKTLGRFLCDSVMQRVLLAPGGLAADLGRKVRTASPAQRKMLVVRDGGCVIPRCGASPVGCDVHHVEWFRDGGATNLDNMVLLCPYHHDQVHDGAWRLIKGTDGGFLAVPPQWIDSSRRSIPAQGPGKSVLQSVMGRSPIAACGDGASRCITYSEGKISEN